MLIQIYHIFYYQEDFMFLMSNFMLKVKNTWIFTFEYIYFKATWLSIMFKSNLRVKFDLGSLWNTQKVHLLDGVQSQLFEERQPGGLSRHAHESHVVVVWQGQGLPCSWVIGADDHGVVVGDQACSNVVSDVMHQMEDLWSMREEEL